MDMTSLDNLQFFPIAPIPVNTVNIQKAGAVQEDSFGEMLEKHLAQVNHLQNSADTAIANLATGRDKDVHNTMIALEKADVALELTMQVRNKALDAYQEIMRMSI